MTLKAGDFVGRYKIQTVIGEGGFGRVYLAWDPAFERPVAIKELLAELKVRTPTEYAEYLERFEVERRVQGQFQHPHIVSVYNLVQQEDNEYLVEEFVDGGTLSSLLQREKSLPPERAIQIGIEICRAIAAVWQQDIVHRDIKPSNILLTCDGHAKLADFGVAQIGKRSQRTQSDRTHPGSPTYMSPEQEEGRGYLDTRSDIYSLGLVLYETLTGKPFKHEQTPIRKLVPEIPRRVAKAVMRALAHEPADRYQSAAAFETALRRTLPRPKPTRRWIGGAILLIGLVIASAVFFASQSLWKQSMPVPTVMPAVTPLPTATDSPSQTPTSPPTPKTAPATKLPPSTTPTATATPTPNPTQPLVVSAPQLISPPGAGNVTTSDLTLEWEGKLPSEDYGFRVTLRHASGIPEHISPILAGEQWTVHLPGTGPASSAVGEWRWSVAVVQCSGAQDVVVRSDEWTFYYNPFGHTPPESPLSP